MRKIAAVVTVSILAILSVGDVYAQVVGASPATPVKESSAGRAMDRITFGALDCNGGADCPGDLFSTRL